MEIFRDSALPYNAVAVIFFSVHVGVVACTVFTDVILECTGCSVLAVYDSFLSSTVFPDGSIARTEGVVFTI